MILLLYMTAKQYTFYWICDVHIVRYAIQLLVRCKNLISLHTLIVTMTEEAQLLVL